MAEFFSSVWAVIADPTWRMWLGVVLCLIGGIATVIASVGVLRFPDFYTRMHAASVTDTMGALTILVGLALIAPAFIIVLKLIMIGVFLVLTGPTATHSIANAAYTAGLQPLIGRYDELKDAEDDDNSSEDA